MKKKSNNQIPRVALLGQQAEAALKALFDEIIRCLERGDCEGAMSGMRYRDRIYARYCIYIWKDEPAGCEALRELAGRVERGEVKGTIQKIVPLRRPEDVPLFEEAARLRDANTGNGSGE